MRIRLLACGLTVLCSLPALAQDAALVDYSLRHHTILGGLGNMFGGIGGSVEVYPFHKRVGLVVGGGFMPTSNENVAAAGGVRFYTGGSFHRLFFEGSFAPVAIGVGPYSSTTHYGLGVALGYSYTSRGGFTLLASGGLGRAASVDATEELVSLGVGYTWR